MERAGKVLAVAVTLGLGVAGVGVKTGAIDLSGNNPGTDPRVTAIDTPFGQLPVNIHHDTLKTLQDGWSTKAGEIKGAVIDGIHSIQAGSQTTTTDATGQPQTAIEPIRDVTEADVQASITVLHASGQWLCPKVFNEQGPELVYKDPKNPSLDETDPICLEPQTATEAANGLGQIGVRLSVGAETKTPVLPDYNTMYGTLTADCVNDRNIMDAFAEDRLKAAGVKVIPTIVIRFGNNNTPTACDDLRLDRNHGQVKAN